MTTETRYEIRRATEADWPAALDVINADVVPGQPPVTQAMLDEAILGRSPVDNEFWTELRDIRVDVLTNADKDVMGVVSYATRPHDQAGVILWLHGREDPDLVAKLVAHSLAELADSSMVEAFSFATALGVGLEALPVKHRAVTDTALRAAGFVSEDLWRYMHRQLPATGLPRATAVETSTPRANTRQLTLREGGEPLAEATIDLPVAGIGELRWIEVEPAGRGRGLGRALLGYALDLLAGFGASEVVLYVDDDDPTSDRCRIAANRLYDSAGFVEIDRLHAYQLNR